MSFNQRAYLADYNEQIGSLAIVDCPCYARYATQDRFLELIKNRESYLLCLRFKSNAGRNRIKHLVVFIVLGSWLDFRIRGAAAVLKCKAQWGCVISKGVLKFFPSFMTYNAISLHVRETPDLGKGVEMYFYVDGSDGVEIKYRDGTVRWVFQQEHYDSNMHGDGWLHLLNRANKYASRPITASEYLGLFDTMLLGDFDMNLLAHRQIVSGVAVKRRFIDSDLAKRKKTKGAGCVNMQHAMESGSLYSVLSKKTSLEGQDWSKNYSQRYDHTLHEGRSNKAVDLIPTVNRAFSHTIRNSPALDFFRDAKGFLCLLNVKDLKKAGEQHVLADFVMSSKATDGGLLYQGLRTLAAGASSSSSSRRDYIVIDGLLVNLQVAVNLHTLVQIKQGFPHVTTRYFRPYVLFDTKGSIPIKYLDQYDCFFSPAEITEFSLPINEYLSTTAKRIPPNGWQRDQAAKNTVAINNFKGSVVVSMDADFHEPLMQHLLGITCYTRTNPTKQQELLEQAVLSCGNCPLPEWWFRHATKVEFVQRQKADWQATDPRKAMRKLCKDMYSECSTLYNEFRSTTGGKASARGAIEFVRNSTLHDQVTEYVGMVFGHEHYEPVPIWNLRLWVMFGNLHGDCTDDAIVIDKRTASLISRVIYNMCFTVDFMFQNMEQLREARFIAVQDAPPDLVALENKDTLIGCMISQHDASTKNSKHCKINLGRRGNHRIYMLHFLPKQHNTYSKIEVAHLTTCAPRSLTVVIRGERQVGVGNGTKLANRHGQKNVTSSTQDLSACSGFTRDGREVHAQLMYSNVSIVGRMPAGQIAELLQSNDLAINEAGNFLAPESLVIHAKHPYSNEKISDVKDDTLTNANCFYAQNLGTFSEQLRLKKISKLAVQMVGFHEYNLLLPA